MARRERAQPEAEQGRHRQAGEREQQGGRDAAEDHLEDRLTIRERVAEVAPRDVQDVAAELLRQGAHETGASELQLEHAWAQFDLGAALRRSRARAEAREPLRAALDLADRIGAARLATLAREELLATGARVARDSRSGPEALTPSERRVAELAMSGMSNKEIAEALWVSRKTVEVHLGHAYAKLGIRSRAQLAGALGQEAA